MARWPSLLLVTTILPARVPIHRAVPKARRRRLTRRAIDNGRRLRLAVILASGLLLAAVGAGAQTTTTSTTPPTTSTTIIVGGGGSPLSDCLLVFQTVANTPPGNPRNIRCADGDPCDADGTVNGVCQFPVSVCGNSTFDPGCTVSGIAAYPSGAPRITVDYAADNGDPKFDPEFQALQNVINGIDPAADTPNDCTLVIDFHVNVQGPFANNVCRRGKKLIRITTESDFVAGKSFTDRDRLKMSCDPAPVGCDPKTFYTSTFDRIQKQVFNQNCAVSHCHDSQSYAGGLLLEEGSSYGSLINMPPNNPCAYDLGWKRVNVTGPGVGDPATSFLFHKVDHDLPTALCPPQDQDLGLGLGMPRLRPKLDQSLIDLIEAWIMAGAPDTGWPPGTF